MVRQALSSLVLLFAMGCASSDTTPSTLAEHANAAARLNGAFVWDCTMVSEDGTQAWRFFIRKELVRGFPRYELIDAAQPRPEVLELTQWEFAQRFTLKDGSEIRIASDGEARAEGQNATRGRDFPMGTCQKGTG